MDRPWVTPTEVKSYSEHTEVQQRANERLLIDISRAEQYILTLTHNTFSNYNTVPDEVKTAAILLAEAFAYNALIKGKSIKSETFDDYSYTADISGIEIDALGLPSLLDAYVINKPRNGVTMKMRKL